jgi:hypothetical protein
MASDAVFPAEEYGTGSRPTPLVDAPAWLKLESQRSGGDRATLTPTDRAFLESAPTYEEGGAALESLAPPALPKPSLTRRILSLVLFVTIVGTASAVLALAVLRYLGHPVQLF